MVLESYLSGMGIQDIRRERLASLIQERYEGSQSLFVERTGENQGEVSALLRNKSFGEKKARKIEQKCNLPEGWLDLAPMESNVGPELLTPPKANVTAFDDIPPKDNYVQVPEAKVHFSAGPGHQYQLLNVEYSEPATYRRAWFQKHHLNPDRVTRFRVTGDSMEPFLYENDTVLVNLAETQIVDGKLYAIRYGEDLRIKYLSRRIDGTLILKSVNPDYPPEEVPPNLVEEHISIVGRVRDRSGIGGL